MMCGSLKQQRLLTLAGAPRRGMVSPRRGDPWRHPCRLERQRQDFGSVTATSGIKIHNWEGCV